MKIKNDFITNSSSTSFIIWGIEEEESDVIEIFANQYSEEELSDNLYEILEEQCKKVGGLTFKCDDNIVFIGLSPSEMKEDETLKEYKEKVLQGLKKMGFNLKYEDIEYIERVSYS